MSSTNVGVSSSAQPHRSPWHSPVPYLFGGLAAMLGLIAFALLILACSYWKLSGYMENQENDQRDVEAGGGDKAEQQPPVVVVEDKLLVIMAGQDKPTYLATPMSSRASSFGSSSNNSACSCSSNSSDDNNSVLSKDDCEEKKDGDSQSRGGEI